MRVVAFSVDGQILASAGDDTTIKLWDANTGDCLHTLQGHTEIIRSVCYSPDGQFLASGSDDRTIRLWDVQTGHCLNTLKGHAGSVRSVVFRDSSTLLGGGYDETVSFGSAIQDVASIHSRDILTLFDLLLSVQMEKSLPVAAMIGL